MGTQPDPTQKVAPTVKPAKAMADKSLLFGFNKVLVVLNVGFVLLVLVGTIVVVMRGSPEDAAALTPLEVTAARSLTRQPAPPCKGPCGRHREGSGFSDTGDYKSAAGRGDRAARQARRALPAASGCEGRDDRRQEDCNSSGTVP